jgi:2-polyprenyl-3-methyl-5-hydroxy-6-metoxy-1,4-benzoquinol methylase
MICPFCGSSLGAFKPTVENRTYHQCSDCQWIALDASHFLSLDQQKERFLQHENTDQNLGYVEMFENFIETCIEPFAQKGSRILDYGCGPEPVLAMLLSRKGYEVKTYDLFFHANETALQEKYDVIVLAEVPEHLANPLEVLKDISEKLNPKGVIVLMTLFHPNDRERFSQWWYRRDKTHVSFYTLKTIEKLASVLGLKLLFSDGRRTAVLALKY